ncbi:MAG: hypothetical protein OQK48_07430 [Sulfurimonas sp.]|uniref:hypothetical protein n=1 Tax=Sulfurimonas sp. TaxID=2022749 RepID=UPI0026235187|nr:hypothetical protein [Sulfurimonas sp.]MCW8895591.1 hypothetical protein [Sulfurimonas sp.]MCW8954762.1 hypothetical protein [Sulfurimonas sp.]MCW9067602.1 hypothetical protein [Sulfurimonas sp.]
MSKISIAISVAVLLMYGCSDKPKEQDESAKTQKVQDSSEMATEPQTLYGASAQQAPVQAPSDADIQLNTPHIADVLETVNAGGYTYAKVDEKGNVYWIAGPQSKITVGTSISFIEQMVMNDFTSKSLNKHFDQLIFVSAIVPADGSVADTSTNDDPHANYDHSTQETAAATTPVAINIAKNANGFTIEELYAKKDSLNEKNIKVDAQVVKVSKNIMGKDWIHLQDGSGVADTSDIIATSVNSTVQVGDKVTTDGIVKTNVDLGYGYQFAILIEEAKFTSIK